MILFNPVNGAGTGKEPLSVRVLQSPEQWDEVEGQWQELFHVSPTASPPLQMDWLRQWWRVYGPAYGAGPDALRVVTMWHGKELVGALPLYEALCGSGRLGVKRLGFISTGEAEFEETCADYMDVLYRPGEKQACLEALSQLARDSQLGRWSELQLTDIPMHSPLINWAKELGDGYRVHVSERGICPISDISGGLDAYLDRLSTNSRQQARRHLRGAQKAGVIFRVAEDRIEAWRLFDEMAELHQARWKATGQPGAFASSRFTQFHRELAAEWVPRGLAVLGRLSLDGRPLAIIYGFRVGQKFDFYQSGVRIEPHGPVSSPGTAALLLLMDHLAGKGIARFDFLRGDSPYKRRLATEQCTLMQLQVVRPGMAHSLYRMGDLLQRASRKGRRMLLGGGKRAVEETQA